MVMCLVDASHQRNVAPNNVHAHLSQAVIITLQNTRCLILMQCDKM